MTVVYFDSGALVKLLVDEPGSDLAAKLWDGSDAALSSRLAYPEVRAALAAAGRNPDAVHLASALVIDDDQVIVAGWDRRLRAGAEAAGLAVSPAALT